MRVDARTKRLTKRLRAGEIAVIDHTDLDRVAAEALAEALTVTERLDDKERRARQGLVSRAVTIR